MDIICKKELCCGCEACKNICPKSAISMVEDEYGVKYPKVNKDLCVDCGLCQKVCTQISEIKTNKVLYCYAANRKNDIKKLDSASGGVASVLYEEFLKNKSNSVVFGVEFDNNNYAKFLKTSNIDDIDRFKGSKYVQASVEDLYKDISDCLKCNMNVLVVGTPCQINAIKNVLDIKKINKDNLITVDLICHGVSPSKYLEEELNYLKEKKRWKKIKNISFRSNRKYRNFHFHLEIMDKFGKNRVYDRFSYEDPYFYAFLRGISLRESCYNCKFASVNRISDITIGDFIGLGKYKNFPKYNDNPINASIILCNTEKGKEYINEVKNEIKLEERNIEEALIEGVSLKAPFPRHVLRQKFLDNYKKYGFIDTMYRIAKDDLNKISKKEKILRPIKIYIGNILDRKKEKNEK